eukprot:3945535-Amphidinium_carterae.1
MHECGVWKQWSTIATPRSTCRFSCKVSSHACDIVILSCIGSVLFAAIVIAIVLPNTRSPKL